METKHEKNFKAVEFMRNIREELSELYNTDQKRYFEEVQKAMNDFKSQRQTSANNKSVVVNG